jgi:hypothetical protein
MYPSIVARQRLDKHVTAAANTLRNRKIRRVVFYAVRVVTKENRRLILPRNFSNITVPTTYAPPPYKFRNITCLHGISYLARRLIRREWIIIIVIIIIIIIVIVLTCYRPLAICDS